MTRGPMVLAWRAAEPGRVGAFLAAIGFEVVADGSWGVAGLVLRVERADGVDHLEAVPPPHGGAAFDAGPSRGTPRLKAIGWATVDAGRLAPGRGRPGEALADDDLLGARAVATGDPLLVLLEPATEGRLAATLARSGEGPAAIYLALDDLAAEVLGRRLRDSGEHPSSGSGPFGRQILTRRRPPWGPHVLLVPDLAADEPGPGGSPPWPDRSATITP